MAPSVLISLITRQAIQAPTVKWLVQQDHEIDIIHGPYTIEHQRNVQIEQFLERDEDFIFILDDDVIPVDNTIEMLLEMQTPEHIMVAPCLAFSSDGLHSVPMAYQQAPDDLYYPLGTRTGIHPATPGMSGALIPREVFSKVSRPWFKMPHNEDGKVLMTEDIYFWKKVHEAGYTVLVNLDLLADHIKVMRIDTLPPAEGTR
jgi:hypothetical protein